MFRILLLLLFGTFTLHAQQPRVEVVPSTSIIGVGGEFDLMVHVRNFPAMRTYGIRLSYDTSFLRCEAVEKTGYFEGYSTFYFKKIDSLQGEAGADESILGPGWTLAEGGLFKLRMRALKEGTAEIGFVTAQFFDSSLAPIGDVTLIGTAITIDRSSGVEEVTPAAFSFDLWPMPWNHGESQLTIRIDMARSETGVLRIVDLQGRIVRVIEDGAFSPGARQYFWDGTDANGSLLKTGVYFAVLATSRSAQVQRFIMIE